MSDQRERAPDSAGRAETDPAIEPFWSTLSVGGLLVAAGAVSPAVYALRGEWPAGYGGLIAAAFAAAGIALLGYSLALRS